MGQKVHPLGFRLGVTEDHKSKWFTKFNNYANTLKIDDILRMEFIKILRTIGDKQKEEIADRIVDEITTVHAYCQTWRGTCTVTKLAYYLINFHGVHCLSSKY